MLAAVLLVSVLTGDGPEAVLEDPLVTPTRAPTAGPSPTPASPAPSPEPGVGQPTAPPAVEGHAVLTDGRRIVLARADGTPVRTLHEVGPEAEVEILSVAARPGSTPDDLSVVLLQRGEAGPGENGAGGAGFDLEYVTLTGGGEPVWHGMDDPYDVSDGAAPASDPRPVWSPDGRHLAWVEQIAGREDGGPVLRTIGWDDGPGTGRPADDNASFELAELPLDGAGLEDWVWTTIDGQKAAGYLYLTSRTPEAWRVDIERQGDGALARPAAGGVELLTAEGGALVDIADGFDASRMVALGGAETPGPVYRLAARGAGEGVVALRLTAEDDGQEEVLPVPEELSRTSDPGSVWMTALADRVVLGAGGRAWLVTRSGDLAALPGTVWSAALLG